MIGLSKTKESVFGKIARAIIGKKEIDDEVLDNLEEVLITSDVGVETTLEIIKRIEARVARDKYVSTKELHKLLKEEIADLLDEVGKKIQEINNIINKDNVIVIVNLMGYLRFLPLKERYIDSILDLKVSNIIFTSRPTVQFSI